MASTYLTRTPGSAGNRKTWTWSGWIKRALLSSGNQVLFEGISGSFPEKLQFTSSDRLEYDHDIAGTDYTIYSSAQYRDPGAWYHVIFAKDTTQTTETNRIKVYVNGEQIAMTEESLGYPPEDYEGQINNSVPQYLGSNASSEYFNGSMANVEMVDGQQLTPAYFGSTDSNTGIWKPGGSSTISDYGTNGFKLAMDTTSPGADTSGKGNTFTPSGTPTLLQGSPSNNWCTLNPVDVLKTSNGILVPTFSNGNTTMESSSNVSYQTFGTFGVQTGKFYWETKIIVANSTGHRLGVFFGNSKYSTSSYYYGANAFYIHQNGQIYYNGSSTTYMSSYTAGDIISVALDRTNGQIYLSKNGGASDSTWADGNGNNNQTFANAVSISTKLSVTMPSDITQPFFDVYGTGNKMSVNFGEGFFGTTAAGTNADGNGQGLFAYAVPSGYYALNTKNLEAYG